MNTEDLDTPYLFRTYEQDRIENDYTISEISGLVSTSSTQMRSVKIREQLFIDGMLGFNNPVDVVRQEASRIFPGHKMVITSLGSGQGVKHKKPSSFFGLHTPGSALNNQTYFTLLTDPELVHERMLIFVEQKNLQYSNEDMQYFRYSVESGMGSIIGSFGEQKRSIETCTNSYLRDPRYRSDRDALVAILSRRLGSSDPRSRASLVNEYPISSGSEHPDLYSSGDENDLEVFLRRRRQTVATQPEPQSPLRLPEASHSEASRAPGANIEYQKGAVSLPEVSLPREGLERTDPCVGVSCTSFKII